MQWRAPAALVIGIGLAGCGPSDTQEATPMAGTLTLTSSAFDAGGAIPDRYGCNGDGLSPPLSWTDVPDEADSFVLIVTDPDAGGFVHWTLDGIPAGARALEEGRGDEVGYAGRTTSAVAAGAARARPPGSTGTCSPSTRCPLRWSTGAASCSPLISFGP